MSDEIILYHGTYKRALPKILEEGLKPRREIPDEPSLAARICLTDDLEEAREWGDGTVIVVSVPERLAHSIFGDGEATYSMHEYWVHRKILPSQFVEVIKADES